MKKVLVTGVAGFIGFHTMQTLLREGFFVVGIDNINSYYDVNLKYKRLSILGFNENEASVWNSRIFSKVDSNSVFIRMNLEDRVNLPVLFEDFNFDFVINLAAQAGVRYSLENPMVYVDSNLVGFVNLLECCRYNKIKHLVYASSSSVYGESPTVPFGEEDRVDFPVSLYAATKKANELLAHTYSHLYKMPTTGLRFFTVYGPYGRPDMAPILFASAINKGKAINVFNNGDMSRDFTFIDDIVRGIIISLKSIPVSTDENPYYQLFNIGNGSPVSLMTFIETLEEEMGIVAEKNMLPMQPGDVPRTWANTRKLSLLGYKSTTSIKEGVGKFVEWFRNN